MEFAGQPGPLGACGFLTVPVLGCPDTDDDEGEVVIGIRPKCSPLPRRRSSVTDDESEPEPPLSGSRRVSFADAKGLNLVQVKEFDAWDVPMPPFESPEVERIDAEEFYLSPLNFSSPLAEEELFVRVQEQKVELETVELLPGTTILRGIVRVQNISFSKAVYVRTTLDCWSSHFDLLTEYLPDSSDAQVDRFSFKLTLVPPFGQQGARVDFCLRYETPVGTFWANNNSRNYVLFCHQRAKDQAERPKKEILNKKSCLKAVSQTFPSVEDVSPSETPSHENTTADKGVSPVQNSQNADGPSGPSEEERKKLQTENRRNCSRRNRRKAARLARVKDYFAQRDGAANDEHQSGAPPPETGRAAGQDAPQENHSDAFSEGSGDPGVSTAPETTSPAVLNDESPARVNTSTQNAEKPESSDKADASTGSEAATGAPEHTLHSNNPTSIEGRNINNSSSVGEERENNGFVNDECNGVDAGTGSAFSPSDGFTFGTVVAPLYHQVFGRVGNEGQSFSDLGNREQTTPDGEDLSPSCPREEITASTAGNREQTGESAVGASNHERIDSALTNEREEESLIDGCNGVEPSPDLADVEMSEQGCADCPTSEDIEIHQHIDSDTDSSSAQAPEELLLLPDDTQEENLTSDVQDHNEAEVALQPDDSSSQSDEREVADLQQTSEAEEPAISGGTNDVDDSAPAGPTAARPASSEEPRPSEAFDPEHVDASTAGGTIPHLEDDAAPETLPEETLDPLEARQGAMSHGEEAAEVEAESLAATPEARNDLTGKDVETVTEETEQVETGSEESTEGKNWETMVEEEEQNTLVSEGGGDAATPSITEDVGEAREELISAEGEDTADETTEEEREELVEAEEEAPEDTEGVMGGEGEESVDETAEQTQTAESERRGDDGGMTGDDREGRGGQEEPGNHFTQNQGVDNEEADVEVEGEMETDADDEDETDTRGGEQTEPEEREAPEAETVESEMESRRGGEGSGGAPGEAEDAPGKAEDAPVIQEPEAATAGDRMSEIRPETPEEVGLGMPLGDPESEPGSRDGSSADSDSDDEVELYMHCLRAVHAGEQANRDAGFAVSKRPAASRSKPPLPAPMPSISESLDEEQSLGCPQDAGTPDTRPAAPPSPPPSGREGVGRNVSWWKETFSCSNVSKALLAATLLVVFLVVAYHYDFLACLGLYLVSVVWLFCHGDKQPVKNNRID